MNGDPAGLRALGVRVQRRSRQIPGLVVLEPQAIQLFNAAPGAAADPDAQADALLRRLQALRNSGLFAYVEPDYVQSVFLVPNDAYFANGSLWGLRNSGSDGGVAGADIGAVRAWDITTGSTNVVVAVVDTGVRYTHEDLRVQMWRNRDEIPGNRIDDDKDGFTDNVYGINAITRSGDGMDDNGHGTHVAGTIGAAANNGYAHVGVAWRVQILAAKFLSAGGFGFTSDAIDCIDFAVAEGADIINASWGGGPYSDSLYDAINNARNNGVLFVAAAGNASNNNDAFAAYPASYDLDNIIAVAALDRRDRLANFSNYGLKTVHLGAPGVQILSSTSDSDTAYATFNGTSMAAPHVSGVAALVLARFPTASLPEIRNRLLTTAVPVADLRNRSRTGGRVNAYQALTAQPDGVLELSMVPNPGSDLRLGSITTVQVIVTDIAGVNNATVIGRVEGSATDIIFRNNGVAPDAAANDATYTASLAVPSSLAPLRLTLTITAPGKTPLSETIVYSVIAPPVNDDFANAITIPPTGGLMEATNKLATVEPGEPLHAEVATAGASVWWNWTPRANANVLIDTAGSSFDTVLAVYTNTIFNSSVTTLRQIAAVDDVEKKQQGFLRFDAFAGMNYRIAVAGYTSNSVGRIRLKVEPDGKPDEVPPIIAITSPLSGTTVTNVESSKIVVLGTAIDPSPNESGVREVLVQLNGALGAPAFGTTNWSSTNLLELGQNTIRVVSVDQAGNASQPITLTMYYRPLLSPNDLFNDAVELVGRDGSVRADNASSSKEFNEPLHGGNKGGKSVWWWFRPTADGILALTTEGSTFDTLLGLYTGTRVTNLTLIASNDNVSATRNFSRLEAPVKALRPYYIAVDGFDGASGTVQLGYSFSPTNVYFLSVSNTFGGTASPGSAYYVAGTPITVTATPILNYEFQGWEGTLSSTENPFSFLIGSDTDLVARFRPREFSDGFETGDLTKRRWATSGAAPWFVQTNVVFFGRFAARSGRIGHRGVSSLFLTENCRQGTGSFALRVGSERSWDNLDFYMTPSGGARQRLGRWSGDVPWTIFTFSVPRGTNVFEWRYEKDAQTSVEPDAGFIDNLDLPLAVPITAETPARLAMERSASGAWRVSVSGQAQQQYVIQASSDLRVWQSVSTNTASGGVIWYTDPTSSSGPMRFYRAIVP